MTQMTKTSPACETNDPSRKGQRASMIMAFGKYKRYAVYATHTRFNYVEWFVEDAEAVADGVPPPVIRQGADFWVAVHGLGYTA